MAKIIPNLVVSVCGQPKSGKSHFALTFPDPIVVFSFDIGIEPVMAKFPKKQVTVKTYPVPIYETVRALNFKKDIEGIWNQFSKDVKDANADPNIKTLVVDTWSAAYEIARIGRTGELGRELDPTEYGDVYLRLKAPMQRTRLAGQNLVLTSYMKEVYQGREPTGEYKLDGWKGTESEADIALTLNFCQRTTAGKKNNVVVTTIKNSRYLDNLNLIGTEIENATYDDLITMLGLK